MLATEASGSENCKDYSNPQSDLAEFDSKFFEEADSETHKRLASARSEMFRQIHACGFTRDEVGIAVREYHAFYKDQQESAWRDEVGPIITDALEYTSSKSLYNLMHDAELADKLNYATREAMVALGIDPASRKWAKLVNMLLQEPSFEGPEDAYTAVQGGHAEFLATRKQQSEERKETGPQPRRVQTQDRGRARCDDRPFREARSGASSRS